MPFPSWGCSPAAAVACSGDDHPSAPENPDAGADAGMEAGTVPTKDATPDTAPPPKTKPDAGRDGGGAEGLGVFEAFGRAQDIIRQSVDHLPARADDAVKRKDAQKIFEFVRARIATTRRARMGSRIASHRR